MKKLNKWPWKNIFIVVLVLALAGVLIGNPVQQFGGNFLEKSLTSYQSTGAPGGTANRTMIASDMAMGEMAMEESFLPPPSPSPGGVAPDAERRELIRTGNLSLIVADVDTSLKEIQVQTEEDWDGIVEESNLNNFDDDSQSGWMRIRVPSTNFDSAMDALKEMALKVDSVTTRVDDVTGQVVDTEARLTNLRAEEEQYLEILTRAETVEETLQATDYLNRVRNEIEWAERSLQNVTERVALSTIHINLIDEGDVEVLGIYWTPWLNVKKAARAALENITMSVDALVAFAINLPLILIWIGIIYIILKLGWKGLKKTGLL